MKNPKAEIIRSNILKLASMVPLPQARVMTLGGEGIEARIWQGYDIPPQNGWLIERNQARGGKLIKGFSYRSHNELRTFPKILAGLYGDDQAFVDYAHIDIFGTLTEDVINDFAPILPLVFKSRAKCLAVTVADSRRNTTLEQWPDILMRGSRLFGRKAKLLYRKMLDVQKEIPTNEDIPESFVKFNPENGAKREFGLLVQFAEVLEKLNLGMSPCFIERYVYVSRYSGRPFRMRTYFFRFESKRLAKPSRALAHTWVRSRLSFANHEGFQEIHRAHVREKYRVEKNKTTSMPAKMSDMPQTPKLAALAALVGGDIEGEYKSLLAKAGVIDKFASALAAAGVVIPGTAALLEPPTSSDRRGPGRPAGKPNKKTLEDLSEIELIDFRVRALELRHSSNGDWLSARREFISKEFGYCNNSISSRVGGLVARMSGKHRESFKQRLFVALGDKAQPYIDRIDRIPETPLG